MPPSPDSQRPIASPTQKPTRLPGRGLGATIAGVTYPLRAIGVLQRHPELRQYVLWPIAVNFLIGVTLYAGLLYFGFQALDRLFSDVPTWVAIAPHSLPALPPLPPAPNWLTNWLEALPTIDWTRPDWLPSFPAQWRFWQSWSWPELPQWFTAIDFRLPSWFSALPNALEAFFLWLLRLILTFLLLLITGFIVLQFGVLLGSPWYGKLSEELEKIRTGRAIVVEVGVVRDIGRAIAYELKKLVLALGIGLPIFLLNFIPGPGTLIGTIGSVAVTATITCMDFLDAPLERRRFRFRKKLRMVGLGFPATGTFALVCLVLVTIPLINLLAIPVCVTAGTLLVCDRILPYIEPVTDSPPES